MLNVCYDYRTQRFSTVVSTDNEQFEQWVDELYDTTPDDCLNGFMGRTDEDTLAVVDNILKAWGLDRL